MVGGRKGPASSWESAMVLSLGVVVVLVDGILIWMFVRIVRLRAARFGMLSGQKLCVFEECPVLNWIVSRCRKKVDVGGRVC